MKKLLLLSSVAGLLIFAAGCKKDKGKDEDTGGGNNGNGGAETALVVEQTQRGFVAYIGATWCPPCGAYGGPAYKEMMKKFTTDEMVSFYFPPDGETMPHYIKADGKSDYAGFLPDLYITMKSKGGIPFFNVNGVNAGGAYTDANYTANTYGKNITDLIANEPQIGVAAVKTLTATKLTCDVKIKAFEDYTGDLYYSVIALENKVVGLQKITGKPDNREYEHLNITRASLVGDGTMEGQQAFVAAASGTTPSGKEFTKSFSLIPPTSYERGANRIIPWDYTPENTSIVVTVWTKVGDNYTYVNGVVAK